ncbi:MAG: DUF4331 family protein [Bacteroidota bacterium]
MLRINKLTGLLLLAATAFTASCKKDHNGNNNDMFDTTGTYTQADQMARPAINTVFVGADRKNEFNGTTPSMMSTAFKADFVAKLNAFGYTSNILGLSADAFAGVLVTDVLNVKLSGTTTFYDGTNVLTGRALGDDVIDTELTLIFGGAAGTANPGLTSDHVNGNDKPFLTTFPYLASPF